MKAIEIKKQVKEQSKIVDNLFKEQRRASKILLEMQQFCENQQAVEILSTNILQNAIWTKSQKLVYSRSHYLLEIKDQQIIDALRKPWAEICGFDEAVTRKFYGDIRTGAEIGKNGVAVMHLNVGRGYIEISCSTAKIRDAVIAKFKLKVG